MRFRGVLILNMNSRNETFSKIPLHYTIPILEGVCQLSVCE